MVSFIKYVFKVGRREAYVTYGVSLGFIVNIVVIC